MKWKWLILLNLDPWPHLFLILYDEYTQSISAAYQNRIVVLRKSAVQFIMLCAELAGIFFHGSPFLLERTIKLRFVQIWVFGTQVFLEIEQEACNSKEDWQYLLLVNKIWAFRQQLEFWRSCTCHYKLNSFLILKAFSDETDGGGIINKCDFFAIV